MDDSKSINNNREKCRKRYLMGGMSIIAIIMTLVAFSWINSYPPQVELPENSLYNKNIKAIQLNYFLTERPWNLHEYPELKSFFTNAKPLKRYEALTKQPPSGAYIFAIIHNDGRRESYKLYKIDNRFFASDSLWNVYETSDYMDSGIAFSEDLWERLGNISNDQDAFYAKEVKEWLNGGYTLGELPYQSPNNDALDKLVEKYGADGYELHNLLNISLNYF